MKEVNNAVKISDLVFEAHPSSFGGQSAKHTFPNGYTASVITGGHSYPNDEEPYEIAVMQDGYLCYDTPVTDDVLGYLTEEAANDILQQIANLPKRGEQK